MPTAACVDQADRVLIGDADGHVTVRCGASNSITMHARC